MFGVEPTRAATEYGYIRPGVPLAPGLFGIERFVEKPDAETAARYVAEGYVWNSGNFVFRAGFLLEEYRRFEPESGAAVEAAIEGAGSDLGFVTLEADAFSRATAKSIDYAVMERTARAAVMPVSYGWSDVGSWQAVWELSERDADGNAAQGKAVFVDARSSYVASDKQLVALLGLDNVVVVTTDDAVLVASRAKRRRLAPGRRAAPASRAGADARPSESAPALGLLSIARSGRPLSGQAHRGEAGRAIVAAVAPSSGRALGCRARHRARDDRRQGADGARK